MCNNIRENILTKKTNERRVKDKIEDFLEQRPTLVSNVKAISLRNSRANCITYIKRHPLRLHDGSRIYEIKSERIDDKYQKVFVTYSLYNQRSKNVVQIERYYDDNLFLIEEFLANSQSIFQLRNINLKYLKEQD